MTKIVCDTRWIGPDEAGRFAREILARLGACKPLSLKTPLGGAWDALRIRRALKAARPDVYFSPGCSPPLGRPVPFVFTLHDLCLLRLSGEAMLGQRFHYRHVVRAAVRKAFRVLTVTEYSRQEIMRWTGVGPTRLVAVGCGVAPAFSPQGVRHSAPYPYLFFGGARRARENLPRLLAALKKSALDVQVRLVLAGKQDKAVGKLVFRAGVGERVAFAGDVPADQLPAWYRGAAAVIMPSLADGCPLTVLESMACGTPVLTSQTGALGEVAGDAALTVEPTDVESIAAGLRRIVEDQSLAQDLRRRGLERARAFTWDRVAQRIRGILDEAAGP